MPLGTRAPQPPPPEPEPEQPRFEAHWSVERQSLKIERVYPPDTTEPAEVDGAP